MQPIIAAAQSTGSPTFHNFTEPGPLPQQWIIEIPNSSPGEIARIWSDIHRLVGQDYNYMDTGSVAIEHTVGFCLVALDDEQHSELSRLYPEVDHGPQALSNALGKDHCQALLMERLA